MAGESIPKNLHYKVQQALDRHRAGHLNEAEQIYREILAADPHNADCLHLLGMIQHQRGSNAAAIELIHRAITASPKQAAYHSNLGTILQAEGRLDEAAEAFRNALALKPEWAEVHSNLGNILEAQGKLDDAAACQQQALTVKPDCAEAWSNLGNVRLKQHQTEQAIACYERALAIRPDYPDAHNNLGSALSKQGRAGEAIAQFERALILNPEYAAAHNNLGNVFTDLDRIDKAVEHYERALFLKPHYAPPHNNLGNLSKQRGNFEEAREHFDQAIAIDPAYGDAHYNRAEIKRFHPGDPDLAALEELVAKPDLTADQSLYFHFALAKALDDIGESVRSFEHLQRGNALKRQRIEYDEAATLEFFRRISAAFDRALLDRLPTTGDRSPVPIFVLGMPRSGSTLVEQILAGHPQIQAAGELTTFETMQATGELPSPESARSLDPGAWLPLAQSYLAALPSLNHGKLRIIDKLPGNFLRIGFIRMMLPNARIIHTVRNPVDTCLSCYSKLFTTGLPFTYDLAELGRYYRAYAELMAHWRSVLPPGAMLDVRYEDVVNDLDSQARRLIDYCGLDWDPRCTKFHQVRRPIKTASAVQARQPLFRTSLHRWRRYEAGLGPLLDALGPSLTPDF